MAYSLANATTHPLQCPKHFILVHGACHGAWCWYKLKPLLESAGHKVTAIDMAASGIDERRIEEVLTFDDYNAPLINFMKSIPTGQKVVLVGHSLGGLNIAFAADQFPEKIFTIVFLTALMPDFRHKPTYVLEKFFERTPADALLDTKFEPYGPPNKNLNSIVFGPNILAKKLYHLCLPEDLALASLMVRPCPQFTGELADGSNYLSKEGYGNVPRVYILCKEDKVIPIDFQYWMIENVGGVKEVRMMDGMDHMIMIFGPRDLSLHLLDIAAEYD
ncbi:salicylic acid-binding protein 2-like [Impatiens glandulifera]|uniref:salicylic acid-binding protein 2-like n=1 Tax=Impatiens glandulifera TaxID=253017 RepID=UPI001FB0A54A|nr:salicylic acid-binding protein 2-like [Impatiens glandulifera]